MDRRLVIGLGGVVAAGIIVLAAVLHFRTADVPERVRGTTIGSAEPPPATGAPRTSDPAAPRLADEDPPAEPAARGAEVRDHRSGERVPYTPRARIGETRTAPRLPPALVHAISKQLEAAMAECTAAIPADPQGNRPKLAGTVFVDVARDRLVVTEVVLRELDATVRSCIEGRWLGQSISAEGAADTTHYEISVVFAVGSRSRGD